MYNYILDNRCKKVLLTEYPNGDYMSCIEYKYDSAIRFVVMALKKFTIYNTFTNTYYSGVSKS